MQTNNKTSKVRKFLTKKRHIYKPYLSVYFDVGFLSLRTDVMHMAYERYAHDYIRLDWRFLKWNGGFNLYKPGVDIK